MPKYDDIIHLPHYVSHKRKPMSLEQRSQQFAPFSALSGYHEKIKEVARITDQKIELGESRKKVLNEKIMILRNQIKEKPLVQITYFVSDQNKEGGTYQTLKAPIRRIDEVPRQLYFTDSSKVPLDDILDILLY